RLTVGAETRSRLAESVETALKLGNGMASVAQEGRDDLLFSQGAACAHCGTNVAELQPRSFSFNSPYGACRSCDGLGTLRKVDPDRVVPDPSLAIAQGAIAAWGDAGGTWVGGTLKALAKRFGFSLDTPWRKLPSRVRNLLLFGSGDEKVRFEFR